MTSPDRTRRWRGVVGVPLAAAALGVFSGRPSLVLLSVVGVVFATYPKLTTAPPVELSMDRTVDANSPAPGDDVEVTVSVQNRSSRVLTDVRVVDGVPPMLSVTDGTPRHAAVLPAEEATSFTYSVTATEGTHSFEPATVIARDVAGATEVETTVSEDTAIECLPEVPDVPLRRQTHQFVGDITTDEGGSGVEFHRTREYHPGDTLSRIDWQRFAKTGDLATVEYREERGAAVVLCLDAREPAYRAASRDDPHAVAATRTAAEQLLGAMADTTHTVGFAALTDRESPWVPPGTGADHVDQISHTLTGNAALSLYPPDEADPDRWDEQLRTVRARLPSDAQVLFLSPLADEFAVQAALGLEAAGNAVTVVSPDVTSADTVGGRLARTERRNRVHSLRESGVRLIDWATGEPLGATLVGAEERWSR